VSFNAVNVKYPVYSVSEMWQEEYVGITQTSVEFSAV
jgi:hypothetical protein